MLHKSLEHYVLVTLAILFIAGVSGCGLSPQGQGNDNAPAQDLPPDETPPGPDGDLPPELMGLMITPSEIEFTAIGQTAQLGVTGVFSNGLVERIPDDIEVGFSSADPSVATISAEGLVTATGPGETFVTISAGGHSQSIRVTVLMTSEPSFVAVNVTPQAVMFAAIGQNQQLQVIGNRVDGSSEDLTAASTIFYQTSDAGVATVSEAGLITAAGEGTATITITFGDFTITVSVAVELIEDPPPVILQSLTANVREHGFLARNQTLQLVVTGGYSDGAEADLTAGVTGTTYASSNTRSATVSENGLITSGDFGGSTITIANGMLSLTVAVAVVPPNLGVAGNSLIALVVSPKNIPLAGLMNGQQLTVTGTYGNGTMLDLTAAGTGTVYQSSDPNVATVTANGFVMATGNGVANITVTNSGLSDVALVNVGVITAVTATSPANGESGVAVTRETIIHFNSPVDPGSIGMNDIFATFGGQRLATRLYISRDGLTATLFYTPNSLPASSRIRVVVRGDDILDAVGQPVDGDNDGQPGGTGIIDFDTLTLTTVPGTAVVGRVFASELVAAARGGSINVPLGGVTITVDGAEATMRTTTDEFGNFRLEPAPAGRFFVHIDGRTAINNSPPGSYYPFVGKAWYATPGQETNVGDAFLPLIPAGTLRPVSQTVDTEITFPPSVLAAFPQMAGTRITIPADSLFADDGTRGGMVGVGAVPPDRIPGRLPEDLNFPMVITVQTDGATNFDRPAPVCFPNLEGLPPGATTALWSFNHDIGEWEISGQMTITPDGQFACTNPGVGIRAPGWHGIQVGVQGTGGAIGGGACNTLSDNAEDTIVCVDKPVTFCAIIQGPGGQIDWTGGGMPATGSGETFTTKYTTPGVKTVTAKLTPNNGDPPVSDSGSVTVIKIEITDEADNVLTSTVTDAALTTVGQQVKLKAKVTPNVASATKEWTIGGSRIRTYEHDIDEDSKHVEKDFMAADLKNKDDISFFWTDAGSGVPVTFKVKKGASECEHEVKFDPVQDSDPNKNLYCANGDARRNPNGDPPAMPYRVLFSHHNWHGGTTMDDGMNPVSSGANWGDAGTDGMGLFNGAYNGSAFLLWHWVFIKAHLAWRSSFNVGALSTAIPPPGGPARSDYLMATPPAASAEESEVYGYVRLGEFKDLHEVGRDTVHPWHNTGHGILSAAFGDADMGTLDSPRAAMDLFWAWHSTIDLVRAAYVKDQAMVTTEMPAEGSTVASATEIIVTFDKRVSRRDGMGEPGFPRGETNTEKITADKLTVNGSAATMIDDVGGAGSRFMVYRFRGFAAPAAGTVTVVLTGTGSYAGKMWTFTLN